MKRKGFSLIEIIVVVGIVSLAFFSIMSLIKRAITIYYSNQNYLSASIIAQDGLELVRFVRDQNWLTDTKFYTNLAPVNPTDNATTTIALDYQATIDNPLTLELDGRQKIIQVYNSQAAIDEIKDSTGVKVDCGGDFDGSGDLSKYIKSSCANIYTDADNKNFYTTQVVNNIDSGVRYKKTIFNRLIQITYHTNGTPDPEDDYMDVASMVYWKDRGSEKYFTLGTYLYDYSWKY